MENFELLADKDLNNYLQKYNYLTFKILRPKLSVKYNSKLLNFPLASIIDESILNFFYDIDSSIFFYDFSLNFISNFTQLKNKFLINYQRDTNGYLMRFIKQKYNNECILFQNNTDKDLFIYPIYDLDQEKNTKNLIILRSDNINDQDLLLKLLFVQHGQ